MNETEPGTAQDAEGTAFASGSGFAATLHDPGIALVRFTRPEKMNAMTQAMKRDLIEFVNRAQMDDAVRVVVFTGEGRAFCSGDEIGGYRKGDPQTVPAIPGGHTTAVGTPAALRVFSQALNVAVRNLDKLSIAAINGPAIQSGLSLALSCDFRIASSDARLGSATLRFALMPDEGGHYLLVQHLGVGRSMDFVMRKRIVSAHEALDLGLVGEVVPHENLLSTAMTLATELAEGPQVAMRMLKRSLYVAAESSFAHALEDIALRTAITDHHADAPEGAASFTQKRPPRFNAWLEPHEPQIP
jgi:2-(1,2-epoxy-1,2-dihydrophenyl)acetyl-CoA isomerase